MEAYSNEDIEARMRRDNPWWADAEYLPPEAKYPKRVYFEPFRKLALNFNVRRAAILLGPRRVGKTFLTKQLIAAALQAGLSPQKILYASVDATIFSGLPLEKFLEFLPGKGGDSEERLIVFDEIQYRKDWEIELKDLVDAYPNIKFVASGSAAAALKLKSRESGAGRFSDFMLPPLTFYEFLMFLGEENKYLDYEDPIKRAANRKNGKKYYKIKDIEGLNKRFIDYLNWGGYPEAVINPIVRQEAEQFIKNDIVDKVLLNDLPSLYGITNVQELKQLFGFLSYNAGNEASYENISQTSGIKKPAIKKYIEYLESAFLIIKISTVDDNCKKPQRERNFKIYLNNPSMRSAFFAPLKQNDDTKIGQLAECAIFSQWQHSNSFQNLRYARWRNEGEVDIVYLDPGKQKPNWIGEIKWSDRIDKNESDETKNMAMFLRRNPKVRAAFITSRTIEKEIEVEGLSVEVRPIAAYCYVLGRNITNYIVDLSTLSDDLDDDEFDEESGEDE